MDTYSLTSSYRGERVLRMRDLAKRLQLSQSRLYALIAEGKFLRPFKLVPGGRAVGWLERDVDAWLANRHIGNTSNGVLHCELHKANLNGGEHEN
jgi:prophage regulatory protein